MILDLFKLDGRVALVTGASGELGQAIALALAEAGADVACVARGGVSRETQRLVKSSGRKLLAIDSDVGDQQYRSGLVDRVAGHFGRVDILVNNVVGGQNHSTPASIGDPGRPAAESSGSIVLPASELPHAMLQACPVEEWRSRLEVPLVAAFDFSRQCYPWFCRTDRGKIINVGSLMQSHYGLHDSADSAASHGLAGLTRSLAASWSSQGINVNCIATGCLDNDPGEAQRREIPCGRRGHPDDIAGLVVFLASNASSYMHGSVITIDGGWSL